MTIRKQTRNFFFLSLMIATSFSPMAHASKLDLIMERAAAGRLVEQGLPVTQENKTMLLKASSAAELNTILVEIKQKKEETDKQLEVLTKFIAEGVEITVDSIKSLIERCAQTEDTPHINRRYNVEAAEAKVHLGEATRNISNLEALNDGKDAEEVTKLKETVEQLTKALKTATGVEEKESTGLKTEFISYGANHIHLDNLDTHADYSKGVLEMLNAFIEKVNAFKDSCKKLTFIKKRQLGLIMENYTLDDDIADAAHRILSSEIRDRAPKIISDDSKNILEDVLILCEKIVEAKENIYKYNEYKSYVERQKCLDQKVSELTTDFTEYADDFYTGDILNTFKTKAQEIKVRDFPGVCTAFDLTETVDALFSILDIGSPQDVIKYLSSIMKTKGISRKELITRAFDIAKFSKVWQAFDNELKEFSSLTHDENLDNRNNMAVKHLLNLDYYKPKFQEAMTQLKAENLDTIRNDNVKKYFTTLVTKDVLLFQETDVLALAANITTVSSYLKNKMLSDQEKALLPMLMAVHSSFYRIHMACQMLEESNGYISEFHSH